MNFQQFIQRIGIQASEVNFDEFSVVFLDECARQAGADSGGENQRQYAEYAVDQLVSYWNEPLDHLTARAVAGSYNRNRVWVEMLRRELHPKTDQDALLDACRRLVRLNTPENTHPGLGTWNEMCVRAVRDIRKAVG